MAIHITTSIIPFNFIKNGVYDSSESAMASIKDHIQQSESMV